MPQVRVQEPHAVGQYDLLLFEGKAFIHDLFAADKALQQKLPHQFPEGHHGPRRGAVDVDDPLGRHAVREQLLVGAGVRDVQHLLHVLLLGQEALDVLPVHPQLLCKRLVVAHGRGPEEANEKLRGKARPAKAIPAPEQRALGRLPQVWVGLFGHAGDAEHLRAELGVGILPRLEDVKKFVVVSQPCQHPGLDLGQVAHHQLVPLGGHDRLAQERAALQVLHVDGAPLGGGPPPRQRAVVGQGHGQLAAPGDV